MDGKRITGVRLNIGLLGKIRIFERPALAIAGKVR
jgi:hypothetical protein